MSTIAKSVKNEHYVPRRYLGHFANEKKFFVFDKEKEQIQMSAQRRDIRPKVSEE